MLVIYSYSNLNDRRMERESRFNLGLNAAKNADYIEKCVKQKFRTVKFPTKNSVVLHIYLSLEWNFGSLKIYQFLNLGMGK